MAAAENKAEADPKPSGCVHAACGERYYVDVATDPSGCHPGAECAVSLQLVATGDFHVNDEYPYKFRADTAPGLEFFGTDAAGKNVFSKGAGDWHKADAKSGAMTVKLSAGAPAAALAGTFKLSVCSAENCLVDQAQVHAAVAVR